MNTEDRSKKDINQLEVSLIENKGKSGVHFWENRNVRFFPVAAFGELGLPQDVVDHITNKLLTMDLQKSTFAVSKNNDQLEVFEIIF